MDTWGQGQVIDGVVFPNDQRGTRFFPQVAGNPGKIMLIELRVDA